MITAFTTFLTHMYWIDLSCVIGILLVVLMVVLWRSKKIEAKNIEYNAQLLELRKNIYMEYERHFVL